MKYYSIGQRKKSRGNLTWYGRTFEDGVLIKEESLRTKNKSEAREWLNAMNVLRFLPENIRARLDPVDKPLSEAYATFFKYVETNDSPATVRIYEYKARTFLTWCAVNGVDTLRDFTTEKGVQFINAVGEGKSSSTIGDYITFMNFFTGWCNDTYHMVDYAPMKGIRPPRKVKRAKSFWTVEQIDSILDNAPSPLFRLYWALMAFAGLRRSEALGLGRTTTIEDDRLRVIGKGNKEAFVPISERLKAEMSLVDTRGTPFDLPCFKHASMTANKLRNAVMKAGLDTDDATDHKFRHSFVSNVYRTHKVTEHELQALARHSSITTTLGTYSHLLADDLRDAVNARKED